MTDVRGAPPAARDASAMRKELLALTGGVPQLQLAKARYKRLPRFSQHAAKWVWRRFTNPARSDGLELAHWVQAHDTAPYPFARFSQHKPFLIRYDDSEYATVVEGSESPLREQVSGWSRQDTDRLFDLASRYELRWFVIADEFLANSTQNIEPHASSLHKQQDNNRDGNDDHDGKDDDNANDGKDKDNTDRDGGSGAERTLDDLKERYYGVCQAILTARYPVPDETQAKEIAVYTFNKEFEIQRKSNLERLYRRTPEQIKEEEELFLELKRREAREERLNRDRQAITLLLKDGEPKTIPSHMPTGAFLPNELRGLPLEQQQERIAKQNQLHEANLMSLHALQAQLAMSPTSQIPGMVALDAMSPTSPQSKRKHSKRKSVSLDDAASANARRRKSMKEESAQSSGRNSVTEAPKEKFPTGVSIRSLRIFQPKVTLIPKCMQMLQELGVPQKPVMATTQVCNKYSELQVAIQTLLEVKKQSDRLEFQINKAKKVAGDNSK